ncbi:hypothetical protein HID58_013824 [Brassica napus]|uniref:Uncharacterized protein n=1 Tax=Brassica napus TaxID=3708 RepID=A0ABQ8DFH4_BRANA|nr:hypothetical protein HID58_013824 [Brassica napus]
MADLSVEDTRSNCLQSSSFPSSLWRPKFGNVTLPIHPHYKAAVLPMSRCVCSDSGKFETSNAVVLDSMSKTETIKGLWFWGIGKNAIDEADEGVEEIKWQTYTGELTPTQEKTKEKVLKLLDKVLKTHMTWPPQCHQDTVFSGFSFTSLTHIRSPLANFFD